MSSLDETSAKRKFDDELDLPPAEQEPQFVQEPGEDGIVIQRLGLEALEPAFPLPGLLRSVGLSDADAERHTRALRAKYQSPFTWPLRKKVVILTAPFIAATLSAYSAGAYALSSEPLKAKWGLSDPAINVGITVFVSAFGFAPMILAPASEAYGRYWVFVGSGVIFFLGTVGCAFTDSYAGMLIARFVTGAGASVFATLTGGVVSDIYDKETRNTPMALYSLAIMIGTGLGPMISGVAVDRLGWRWIFFIQLMTIGVTVCLILIIFKETRSNVILARKCDALNKIMAERGSSHDVSIRNGVRFEPQNAAKKLSLSVIQTAFAFPMRLLISEPVVFCFSLWASFAWAILYMQFNSIGIVFRDVYGFDSAQVGLVYAAVIAASILGTILAIAQDPITRKIWPERMNTPEGRLISPGLSSILLPAGLFWFGWTATPGVPWISPALAIGSCTMGIFSIYLAVFNYLADTYGRFASSAQAAQSMCRNLLAGIFPLFTHIMLRNLTYSGAGSMLGGIGLALTAIPWLLSFYGKRIRSKSPFAKAVIEM